jgi:enoyl-CoA hydratase/carnithine racemase
MNPNTDKPLLIEQEDCVAYITLHNPKKRNALTPDLLVALCSTLETFAANDEIRCVVIRGYGDRVFSSGYDIGKIQSLPLPDKRQETPEVLLKALNAIKKFPYPTIAMLTGDAFGAGLNLCACCDIRIAAHDIRLGMTPARLGVAYHPEGIQQFIEAFGIARTKELFYTAGIFQGEVLIQKGFVDHMVPKSTLEDFTRTYAGKITRNAPLSLKGIKKIIALFENNLALDQSGLDQADQLIQKCFQSDDLKEGQTAFLEKRAPTFTGK